MMGRQTGDQSQLFYLFNLEERIPERHLLRRINPIVMRVLADLREKLEPFYSEIGRPSIDPELMLRADLYGDGVNIAARLEAIADPGGIIVSGSAFDHIKSKVKVSFDDIGPQRLKNIAEPVRAYRITSTPAVAVAGQKRTGDKPAIAVLPFANMSGDPQQQCFSDGITEDIITELQRFKNLRLPWSTQ